MTTGDPTGRANANRYAVPLADLDAVRVTRAQTVELIGGAHRPPPEDQMPASGDWSADPDGE